jgi:hypothetical protein
MSWHWSRLSMLTFLALLYAAPLSTGDKGLWLSVAGLPAQVLGTAAERLPAEHSSLIPDAGSRTSWSARSEHDEPWVKLSLRTGGLPGAVATSRYVDQAQPQTSLAAMLSAPAAPRGPPA